jgi:dienelactone hydrolase
VADPQPSAISTSTRAGIVVPTRPRAPSTSGSARALRAALAAGALAVAACGGGSTDGDAAPEADAAPTTAPAAPLEVDVVTETFVDTSRPTAAGTQSPARPERTIVTRIAHPTDGGPYPLVVLAHGASGHPDEYSDTVPLWASDGFVVASPAFPLTNREVPGALANAGDVVNQPGDVSFVIDQVLAANDDPSSPLHGLVDPDAIGVVGHSLGGATTWAVSFSPTLRDERIDSAVVFAGLTLPMGGSEFEFDSGLPLLVMHGDRDDIRPDLDMAAYEQAVSPKWFVTLLGAEHVPAFTDAASPYDDLVTRTVLDFWHGTLDGDAAALERVTTDATDPALATVLHE